MTQILIEFKLASGEAFSFIIMASLASLELEDVVEPIFSNGELEDENSMACGGSPPPLSQMDGETGHLHSSGQA